MCLTGKIETEKGIRKEKAIIGYRLFHGCLHEDWSRARIYSKRRIKFTLERNGFMVQDMKYVTAPMDVAPKVLQPFLRKYIFNNDTTTIPFLAIAIAVKVKKKQHI